MVAIKRFCIPPLSLTVAETPGVGVGITVLDV
jgi:hypothetical protein